MLLLVVLGWFFERLLCDLCWMRLCRLFCFFVFGLVVLFVYYFVCFGLLCLLLELEVVVYSFEWPVVCVVVVIVLSALCIC